MIDLNKICRVLESERCKTHGENPNASVIDKSIKLTTCCEDFQQELEKVIDIEVSKQLDDAIDDAIQF